MAEAAAFTVSTVLFTFLILVVELSKQEHKDFLRTLQHHFRSQQWKEEFRDFPGENQTKQKKKSGN